jgi:nicotinate-nucleotide pyrophosphorylase (carboxylating)
MKTLRSFLEEDAPHGDITSEVLVEADVMCRAVICARQDGIAAGLEESARLFSVLGVEIRDRISDGCAVRTGTVLMDLSGPARAILLVERTALNLIGRMGGIATRTHELQQVLDRACPGCRIAATRKTAPGLRALDKKAVVLGGGEPHRTTLSDGFLIKDNHLALVPLEEAVRRARASTRYRKVEIEVQTPADAERAARAGADIILLDNMRPDLVRETITRLVTAGEREKVIIEVSGGIKPENLADYAIPGVDVISMGALTHSVLAFDASLDILPERQGF